VHACISVSANLSGVHHLSEDPSSLRLGLGLGLKTVGEMNPQNALTADRGVMQFDVRAVKFSTR